MSSSPNSSRTIVAILVIAVVIAGFWIVALSPKRQQASELGQEVETQRSALVQAQSQVTESLAAKRGFSGDYNELVVLGKAVPANDETASLLVELNRVADEAHVRFDSLQLESSEGTAPESSIGSPPEASATSSVPASATIPPTEAEAALLPLGATIGSAGLSVMPYDLEFTGSFFHVADFIHGIDSLVNTQNSKIAVDGRLVTLDGFALNGKEFPRLTATFKVTTYLTSPNQGLTAGATESAPAEAAPPATTETTTGTPSSAVVAR